MQRIFYYHIAARVIKSVNFLTVSAYSIDIRQIKCYYRVTAIMIEAQVLSVRCGEGFRKAMAHTKGVSAEEIEAQDFLGVRIISVRLSQMRSAILIMKNSS